MTKHEELIDAVAAALHPSEPEGIFGRCLSITALQAIEVAGWQVVPHVVPHVVPQEPDENIKTDARDHYLAVIEIIPEWMIKRAYLLILEKEAGHE